MKFSNKAYDSLKFVALILLPALAVLYFGLGQEWGWPSTGKVVASITLLDTFLGALLQISTSKFNNEPQAVVGYLDSNGVDPDTGIPHLALTVTTHPSEILNAEHAILKVGPPPPPGANTSVTVQK